MFEKVFKLTKNGSSVKTEVMAGITTFMTMAYIIALNPNLLTNFDTGSALWNLHRFRCGYVLYGIYRQ